MRMGERYIALWLSQESAISRNGPTLVAPPTVRPSSVLAYLYPRASTDDPGAPVRLPVLYRLQLYTVHLHAGLLACYSAAIGSLSVILNTERITRVLLHTAVDRPMAMSGM